MVPEQRVLAMNEAPIRKEGEFVLYWMVANRRSTWNFSLQRAVEQAERLQKPLVILEDLRLKHRWAAPRFHRWVIQGMEEQQRSFSCHTVLYHPFVERQEGEGRALLKWLCERAAMVVTDWYPCFFLPEMVISLGKKLGIRLEAVDSNGLMPLVATPRDFSTAYLFRRFLQKNLYSHLSNFPAEDPLSGHSLPHYQFPPEFLQRWSSGLQTDLSTLPLDQEVGPLRLKGGAAEGTFALRSFLRRLSRYGEYRNDPDEDAPSGLSPYLHWGHLSVHQIFAELSEQIGWNSNHLGKTTDGSREGWWGTDASTESFLDELVTWRELGYVFGHHRPDYDRFESLPEWAKETLNKHSGDTRPTMYQREEMEEARTHDPVWNAAQRELRKEGKIHNYLRMLWGKKILEWSPDPRTALQNLIEINNRWAIDGRDPNSYSGIFWTLGRFDRAWGPERPIYGTVRYMTSDNTLRKIKMKEYLRRYGPTGRLF